MKLAVCIKWVPDPAYPFRAGPDGIKIEGPGLAFIASPVDMAACETAMRLKEAAGGSVALYTAGVEAAEAGLRAGLALGADEAVRVALDDAGLSGGIRIAQYLAAAMSRASAPDVVLCGVCSPDWGSGAVPAALAAHLGATLITGVVSVYGSDVLEVQRRLDGGGRELLRVRPPAVLAVEDGICEPRYPTLLARRRADRTPIATFTPAELGGAARARPLTLEALQAPRPLSTRLVAPPSELTARERLRFILAGGPDQSRAARRLEGPVDAVVEQLLLFLQANGVAINANRALAS
jgi:electron transfer flavoprotein beta subunit